MSHPAPVNDFDFWIFNFEFLEDQRVILVDENDNSIGETGKMEAHLKGLRHRAFSVFIFNSKGEMLLQQRALNKYHSGGLWSNACCSHPSPGEETELAAIRRLNEELGFSTSLKKIFDFTYRVSLDNGLIENELDHVFAGEYEGAIHANPGEVNDYSFKSMKEINTELLEAPSKFTSWFQIALPKVEAWWKQRYGVTSGGNE